MRAAVTAGLVFAGCYLGASFGTWLRFPEIGTALLFPSYAVLTAALWKSPPRQWWMFLVAASAGNFLPHMLDGTSVTFVLCAELVNDSRALIAAILLRRFAGDVQTLREIAAYLICSAFVAPCVGGVLGATLVTTLDSAADFGLAMQQWSLSNSITAVTILPMFTIDLRKLAALPRRRMIELVVVAVAIAAISASVLFYLHPVRMYWALPLLLLTSARYGAPATGAALLVVTVLASLATLQGSVSSENLLDLQVFMIEGAIPLLLIAVVLDEHRKTAAELTESRRQYRSVVEDQTEMICRYRPDGTYTFANRAFCAAFEVSDPVGRTIWDVVPRRAFGSSSGVTGDPIQSCEVNLAADDEPPRWQQWQVRALYDDRGAIDEYQAVGRDISDRKHAEQEHRELAAQRSLESALREADRRKDEFLAMLGHELRNPLTPIGTAVEVLVTVPPGGSEAVWARDLIRRQLGMMTRLIDDLLDLSRITLGKIELQLGATNLAEVVDNAVEATRSFIDSFGHTLIVKLPDDPVWLHGDAVRLTQVVANLLHNAAKYTERGGRIEVGVSSDGGHVSFVVRDNGIGLEADAVEKIFELFAQVPTTHERAHGGLGIGLTLARRLVELHGGTVTAHSEGRDRGSEIIVTLPVVAAVSQPSSPLAPVLSRSSMGLRILTVDDNVDLATGLVVLLGRWGHTVHMAHDARGALEAAAMVEPEVVILDICLPDLNGLELAQALKQAERAPGLLVSMSGLGQDHVRARALESGFDHHVVKPLDLEWLRTMLDDFAQTRDR